MDPELEQLAKVERDLQAIGETIMSRTITKEEGVLLNEASEMFDETGCVPGIDGEQVPATFVGNRQPRSEIEKNADLKAPFEERVEMVMKRDGCNRLDAMRKARHERAYDFAGYQLLSQVRTHLSP